MKGKRAATKKKGTAKLSEARVKFEGKKADVAAFEEYCSNVRALLRADACPDLGTYRGLCQQIETVLPGDKLRRLALEQTCSRHLEFILNFIDGHTANIPFDDEEHDARVECAVKLVKHFLREFLGHCAHTAQSDYGSHFLETLFGMIPTLLKHTAQSGQSSEELKSAMNLNFAELTLLAEENGESQAGCIYDLLVDARATCVLRSAFATSVGCRWDKTEATKLNDISEACCSDKVADLALRLFGDGKSLEWLYSTAYVSPIAAPTIQALLLAVAKIKDSELDAYSRRTLQDRLLPHRLDGSLDVECLDHLVRESGAGNRMIEFVVHRSLNAAGFAMFVDEYLLPNARTLSADSRANYIVQATLRSDLLKGKQFQSLLREMEWATVIQKYPGVAWAAVDAAGRLNAAHADVLGVLVQALGSFEKHFWPSLLLLVPKSDPALLTTGRVHPVGVSIGQSLLDFPLKIIADLVDSLISLIKSDEFPLKQTACHKQASYLYQKLIQVTAKSARFGLLVTAFTPISRTLALHPTGSFVLGELLTHAKGEERQMMVKELQSILIELRARNFSLYKKHKLGNADNKVTASDSRFRQKEIKPVERKKNTRHAKVTKTRKKCR